MKQTIISGIIFIMIMTLVSGFVSAATFTDNFTRANEDPISTNGWSSKNYGPYNMRLYNNEMYFTTGTSSTSSSYIGIAYYNTEIDPPIDVSFIAKVNSPPVGGLRFMYGGDINAPTGLDFFENAVGVFSTDTDNNLSLSVIQSSEHTFLDTNNYSNIEPVGTTYKNYRFVLNNTFIGLKVWNLEETEPEIWGLSDNTFNINDYTFDNKYFSFSVSGSSHYQSIYYDNISITYDSGPTYSYDDDGGLNYTEGNYTYNLTETLENDTIAYDYCTGDDLTEFYLVGDNVESTTINCVALGYYGCIQGMCVNQSDYETIEEGLANGTITPTPQGYIQNDPTITTDQTTETIDNVLGSIQNNIEIIFALLIIIGLVVITAQNGVTNPLVLMFAGIIGAVIMTILGFIETSVLIIILVSLALLMFLGLTIFKEKSQ